jgi:hypothetical protein
MSCDISNGVAEPCKSAVGGLDAIYIINYGDYTTNDLTYDGTQTDMINDINGVSNIYKFELKGANSFEQTITSSRDNGTTYVEQVLTVNLKQQSAAKTKLVKLLSYGRPHIIVRTRANQYFLAGLERGMDLTTGVISNGTAMGDMNGYTLTFTGQENIPANFLNCSTEAGLVTVMSSATIVTS